VLEVAGFRVASARVAPRSTKIRDLENIIAVDCDAVDVCRMMVVSELYISLATGLLFSKQHGDVILRPAASSVSREWVNSIRPDFDGESLCLSVWNIYSNEVHQVVN
jgi:hypothetical protein